MLVNPLERSTKRAQLEYSRASKRVRQAFGSARIKFLPSISAPDTLAAYLSRDARFPQRSALQAVVQANFDAHGEDLLELRLHQALCSLKERNKLAAGNRLLHAALAVLAPERAIDLAEAHVHVLHESGLVRTLVKLYHQHGSIERPYELMQLYLPRDNRTALHRRLSSDSSLRIYGMPYLPEIYHKLAPSNHRRILYHVSQCPPHHNSGYAIRTQSLVQTLRSKNWDLEVFARFGYPNDRHDFLRKPLAPQRASVAGIDYHFMPVRRGFRSLSPQRYQEEAVRLLCEQAQRFRPALIHTASNQIVGLAGTQAATRLGIPSIYEMRGLWHMSRAAEIPEYLDSEHYRLTQALEMQAARQADHVFALTGAIADLLRAEGIADTKITVVPNAVDTDHFTPRATDTDRKAELGFGEELVIGFIGTFGAYEGLDLLLHACALLRQRNSPSFRLLLVGDGEALPSLKTLAIQLGLQATVTFSGRVPHDQVLSYYSLFDVAAYPRKGLRVCEVVSPLKPYEAMAMEKAVIVSDVQALAEMVQDGQTGLVHAKDDIGSLADCLERVLRDRDLRHTLGINARRWLVENRTWDRVTERVAEVYTRLIDGD